MILQCESSHKPYAVQVLVNAVEDSERQFRMVLIAIRTTKYPRTAAA